MSESEPTDLDRDVDASMRMFEKSKVGKSAAVIPKTPTRALLVFDGSPQDQAGIATAKYMRERFDCLMFLLDARDNKDDQRDLGSDAASEIHEGRPLDLAEGESYDTMLRAIEENRIDFLIVPCPFGRSFENVGTDSVGTVIDVLLARCPVPMLVLRRDDQRLAECCQTVSMVVGGECEMEGRAAAWAFGLAGEKATVTLNLVIEKEQYENIRSIVEALTPETSFNPEEFSEALTKTHQDIHGAMAKTASANGMSYYLRPQAGEVAPPNPLNDDSKVLLVMPLEVDDRFGQGFVQDRIRRSPHPVLVVPGHVKP